MARRRDPGNKEYSPLDDAKGRLPIEEDLVRDVIGDRVAADIKARKYLAEQMEKHFFGEGAEMAQGYVPPSK